KNTHIKPTGKMKEMIVRSVSIALLIFACLQAHPQRYQSNWKSLENRSLPRWFQQEKFGIFIHWGVYSVPAYAPIVKNSGESYAEWYWTRMKTKGGLTKAFHEANYGAETSYFDLEQGFRAELFNPEEWASVFKRSGA